MAVQSAPSIRDRAALVVLQLGALAVVLAALPYKLFDLDRYFVPKELVLHVCAAVAALLCVTARRRVTISVVDALLGAFLVLTALSMLVASNVWAAERATAISVSAAFAFWAASSLRRVGLARPLLVALAVGVVLAAATSLAQVYGLQTEYFSLNRAPGGTFGNRNFVAHVAAIGTPVLLLATLTARRGFGSLFGGIGMAVVAAALVLSRSRGAWLAVLVLGVAIGTLAVFTRDKWSDAHTTRRLGVLAAAAVAGTLAAVILPNRLEWKSDSPYLDSAAGLVNYKEGSGKGRLVQYGTSLRMAAAHPLLGVGPGNWPVVYPKFAGRGDPSMSPDEGLTSNPWPSSDWVAFLSERGAVATACLMLAMLALLVRSLRDLARGAARDPERVLTSIALVGTLVAAVVVGAFDAVLLVAAPAFFVWTLAGALAPPAARGIGGERDVRALGSGIVIVLGAIAIARSATQAAAITVFSTSTKLAAIQRAALLDPGSYRIRTRLAQTYLARGDCARARVQARAARALFPSAGEPKRELADCGGR